MKFFRPYTFEWWQMGIFKLALLSLGVALGAFWSDFFKAYMGILLAIAIVLGVYLIYISFKKEDVNMGQGQIMR